MRVFVFPWMGHALIHHRSAASRRWYSFTYPARIESWVSLGRKEGPINIWVSANPRIELGTLWLEGRDLTNCANHANPMMWLYWMMKLDCKTVSSFAGRSKIQVHSSNGRLGRGNESVDWSEKKKWGRDCFAVYDEVQNKLIFSVSSFRFVLITLSIFNRSTSMIYVPAWAPTSIVLPTVIRSYFSSFRHLA